jgi:hypothetical protein
MQPTPALGVPSYPQNDPDDRTGRGSDRLGDHVEIETYLRSDHRQDEKDPDQDHHPIGLQPGKRSSERFWEQSHRDPSTIEWRQWQQIEDRQNDVDDQRIFKFSASHRAAVSGT